MKSGKKLISVFLAVLMLISSLSAFFVAFAANEQVIRSAPVTALEEKITALLEFKTVNFGAAKPTITVPETDSKYESQKKRVDDYEKALALYDEIAPMYKALTETEKDMVDIQLTIRFLQKGVQKEAFEVKNANPELTQIESSVKGQTILFEKIGPHAARDTAIGACEELWNPVGTKIMGTNIANVYITTYLKFTDYPKASDVLTAFIDDYRSASPLVRRYMDGINPSTQTYGNIAVGARLRDIVKMIVKKQMDFNEFPFTGSDVKPTDKKEAAEWTAEKYNWEAKLYETAFISVTNGVEDLKTVADTIISLRDAYIVFDEIGNIDNCEKAISQHDNMSDYDKLIYSNISYKGYSYALQNSKGVWYTTQINVNKLYEKCIDARNIVYVNEFADWLKSIDLSKVDNFLVAEAIARFGEIPASVRNQLSEEAQKIYDEVLSKYDPIKPLTPSNYDFALEISAHNMALTDVELPKNNAYTNENGTDAAMAELDKLVNQLIAGDNGTLAEGIFTNATVGKIFELYNTINNSEINVDIMGASMNIGPVIGTECSPVKVAELLCKDETCFAVARKKLIDTATAKEAVMDAETGKQKIDAWGDPVYKYTSTTAEYAGIVWENGDWGFEDGDKEGFKQAIAAALRPVAKILNDGILIISKLIQLPNYTADNGDYCYGAYEKLLPALESIGLKMISSAEYTANYQAALAECKESSYSALLYPVVDAIVELLSELSDAPVETIVKFLPQIGYAVDSGILDESVKATLATSSTLSGLAGTLDLTGSGLNAMLTASPISLALDESTTLSLQLNPINWNALSGCGTAYCADSVRAGNKYRMGIESDKVKTFAYLYYYLYNTLFSEPNFTNVKNTFKEQSKIKGLLISGVLNTVERMGKIDSYSFVLNALNGDIQAGVKDELKGAFDEIFKSDETDSDKDNETNPELTTGTDNKDKEITDNPAIPQTAGARNFISALFVISIGAAATGCAVHIKKRNE